MCEGEGRRTVILKVRAVVRSRTRIQVELELRSHLMAVVGLVAGAEGGALVQRGGDLARACGGGGKRRLLECMYSFGRAL